MRSLVPALWMAAALAAGSCSPSPTPAPSPSSAASAEASPVAPSPLIASPSPLIASPSPSPASPTPGVSTPGLPACTSTDLAASVTDWQGAMGSRIATVKLVNASTSACIVQGKPQLQLVDAAGRVLLDSATAGTSGLPIVSPGDKAWIVAPGDWVTTMVQTSNYCGALTPVTPVTIAFILPSGGGRLVAAADKQSEVPGCNGSPGDPGVIAMNGWAR